VITPVITPATEAERNAGERIAAFETPGEWPKQPEDVVPLARHPARPRRASA
jgi:hypothetical protein